MHFIKLTLQFAIMSLSLVVCKATENPKSGKSSNLGVIVLSQPNSFHAHRAALFKDRFDSQVEKMKLDPIPKLFFTHLDFKDMTGAWTVFPLIQDLMNLHDEKNLKWFFFCEEDTHVNVEGLLGLLSNYDADEMHFLGRELRDDRTTIIHHFAFSDNPKQFAYPDFVAGFALSIGLVKRMTDRLVNAKRHPTDFSIDPKHELALFIWEGGNGTSLTNIPEFCFASDSSKSECITSQPVTFAGGCPPPIEEDDLFVAVKTCKKFHTTRVKVVQETWGKEASLIEYFSEEADKSIPTVSLGVPNTERGHCGKTMSIIKQALISEHMSQPSWLLIADDDTIINLERLRALLACYKSDEPVALGERYGYAVSSGGGYDYITGGGGMVFSHSAVVLLAQRCNCYADDAPDDMTLGMCLKGIGIPITHSRYFHQARPEDYSKELLSNQMPVSFHKHWETDPYKVYASLTKDPLPSRVNLRVQESNAKSTNKDEL